MRGIVAFLSLLILMSAFGGARALEMEDRAHQLGGIMGLPVGLILFLIPLPIPRVFMLFVFQCSPILGFFMNIPVKYFTLFLAATVYDFVESLSKSDPDATLSRIATILSWVKGFFDGTWKLGRLSLWRIGLSPVGKMANGLLATLNVEDYHASRMPEGYA